MPPSRLEPERLVSFSAPRSRPSRTVCYRAERRVVPQARRRGLGGRRVGGGPGSAGGEPLSRSPIHKHSAALNIPAHTKQKKARPWKSPARLGHARQRAFNVEFDTSVF